MKKLRKESLIERRNHHIFVELTGGAYAEIDEESLPVVAGYPWYLNNNGYAVRNRRHVDGPGPSTILMHRVIFEHREERLIDPALTIDHKDKDKLNNLIENLREANAHEQGFNKDLRSDNTSGFRGVTWNNRDRKWQAQVTVSGKKKSLGYFEDLADAIWARQEFDRSNHQQIQPEEIPA